VAKSGLHTFASCVQASHASTLSRVLIAGSQVCAKRESRKKTSPLIKDQIGGNHHRFAFIAPDAIFSFDEWYRKIRLTLTEDLIAVRKKAA
jgi:hypothetical protein